MFSALISISSFSLPLLLSVLLLNAAWISIALLPWSAEDLRSLRGELKFVQSSIRAVIQPIFTRRIPREVAL